jgi:hypothetical protein
VTKLTVEASPPLECNISASLVCASRTGTLLRRLQSAAHSQFSGTFPSANNRSVFIILESHVIVRPIAKRLVLRRAAAAQRVMLSGQRASFTS